MEWNYELTSDLTFILDTDQQIVYVKMNGVPSTSVIAVQILDTGGKCVIQSTIDSTEYFSEVATSYSDLLWENIKVDGSYVTEVTSNILSTRFATPNFLYIKNTSGSNKRVKISLRGNR
jgi:hypothetical protein